MYSLEEIQQTDKEIADLIQAEVQRQKLGEQGCYGSNGKSADK